MNKTDLDALLKYGYTLEELLGFDINIEKILEELLGFDINKPKKTYDFCRDINLNNISPMGITCNECPLDPRYCEGECIKHAF